MPNWCFNKLIVDASTLEFDEFLRDTDSISFSDLVMPDTGNPDGDTREQMASQIRAWGTKWDLDEEDKRRVAEELREGCAYFETAWAPPLPVIDALAARFEGASFILFYFEPGNTLAGIYYAEGKSNINRVMLDEADIRTIGEEHFDWDYGGDEYA